MVLKSFIDDLPNYLKTIQQAVENNDHEETRKYFHKIKGAAANVQVTRLSRLAHNLETMAENKQLDEIIEKLPELQQHTAEVIKIINEKIKGLS